MVLLLFAKCNAISIVRVSLSGSCADAGCGARPAPGEFPLQFPHAGRRRFAHGLLKHLVHDQHGVLDFHAALEGSRRTAVRDLAAADRAVLPPVDLPAWRMAQRVFSLLAPSMLPELVQ